MSIEYKIGDCLQLMKGLPDKSIDLVLTDPPYGIGKKWTGGWGSGWKQSQKDAKERYEWDINPPCKEVFEEIFRVSKNQVIWGGNYFDLPPSRCWLVWNKPERGFTLAEAELAWTSYDNVVRVFDHNRHEPNRLHPTQKPSALFEWILERYTKPNDTVLDPFLGSGTTLLACRRTGRNGIGYEINPDYEEIIKERIMEKIKDITTWGATE